MAPLPLPVSPDQVTQALGWIFDKVAGPIPPPGGPGARLTDAQINRQIALHATMAGTAGFVSNLGGLLTLPVALPANLLGIAAIQLKLIATIAAGRGYDVGSEEVRALGLACLTGGAALKVVKEAGVQAGLKLGNRALGHLSASAMTRTLSRAVPLLGGLVGGTIDAAGTRAVGAVAKRVFPPLPLDQAPPGTPQLPAPAPAPNTDPIS